MPQCPPGYDEPDLGWTTIPFGVAVVLAVALLVSAREEEGRLLKILGASGLLALGAILTVALFLYDVTRCVPV